MVKRRKTRAREVAGENQTGICLAHYLHGLHEGHVRVRGRAPDALVWDLGERE